MLSNDCCQMAVTLFSRATSMDVGAMAYIDYGGECDVIVQATGERSGRFWIDIEFSKVGLPQSLAALAVPCQVGAELKRAGPLVVRLDDGRRLYGVVTLVTAGQTLMGITRLRMGECQ